MDIEQTLSNTLYKQPTSVKTTFHTTMKVKRTSVQLIPEWFIGTNPYLVIALEGSNWTWWGLSESTGLFGTSTQNLCMNSTAYAVLQLYVQFWESVVYKGVELNVKLVIPTEAMIKDVRKVRV